MPLRSPKGEKPHPLDAAARLFADIHGAAARFTITAPLRRRSAASQRGFSQTG
jgi:hypothetical protein